MAHDVFLCYSSRDKQTADAACSALEASKLRCWIAPRDVPAGATWAEALLEAIRSSRVFVLIFSAQSNESPQVLREVDAAVKGEIPIIPFRVDETLPSRAIEYYVSTAHWLDAFTPPLARHLDRLAAAIHALLGAQGPPSARAPDEPSTRSAAAVRAGASRRPWAKLALVALLLAGAGVALAANAGLFGAGSQGKGEAPGGARIAEAPPKDVDPPPRDPTPPPRDVGPPKTPVAAWEVPLAEALSAMARGDGEAAKAGLARADEVNVPANKVRELQRFVAAWEFLRGWAEPGGPELDAATGFPQRIVRRKDRATMVIVPAGVFWMGRVPNDRTKEEEHEVPRHRVTLTRAYYLDEHEVTVGQFAKFVADAKHVTLPERQGSASSIDLKAGTSQPAVKASWRDPNPVREKPEDWDRYPVQRVSWDDAMAYCRWAGVSLPTEAQFERALREGREGEIYPWGNQASPPRAVENLCDGAFARSYPSQFVLPLKEYEDGWPDVAPAKSLLPNAYGLYDLNGNLEEWCLDVFAAFPGGAAVDPRGPSEGPYHVTRGGDYLEGQANDGHDGECRSSYRRGFFDTGWSHGVTFRGAITLP